MNLHRKPLGLNHPSGEIDDPEEYYRHSSYASVPAEMARSQTTFAADHDYEWLCYPDRRRDELRRMFYLDQGMDINPSDPKFGPEAHHYAESEAPLQVIETTERLHYHKAEAFYQQIGLPEELRDRALGRIVWENLDQFNHYGGIDGAIIGFAMQVLVNHLGFSDLDEVRETDWWPMLEDYADETGVYGATGRTFRQLLDHMRDKMEDNDAGR